MLIRNGRSRQDNRRTPRWLLEGNWTHLEENSASNGSWTVQHPTSRWWSEGLIYPLFWNYCLAEQWQISFPGGSPVLNSWGYEPIWLPGSTLITSISMWFPSLTRKRVWYLIWQTLKRIGQCGRLKRRSLSRHWIRCKQGCSNFTCKVNVSWNCFSVVSPLSYLLDFPVLLIRNWWQTCSITHMVGLVKLLCSF